ncbi:hypothetical protein AGRO_5187 [Agrobacterium sp. ATCC 31749]|uniref:hypothetical protein n=1 Tax=unclassified Agrobacterium TaxID=2632611 RepID=UPI00020DBE61|nr:MULTISPECIES: hypothetical protein [unclassified Agrobacterium]EGL62113.1 hypothetical protein AGRO_5187 [Agrobacterium sp. ATCC 31749]QKX00484.1 hypothetical protein GSF67_25410 [Agrobacterium sp. CGMCC 11546]
MSPTTIQYTSEQARTFADVSPEAWRHWRKVIPWLAAKSGKGARFTAGELIALAALSSAVHTLDIGIAKFASRWDELFGLCAQQSAGALRSAVVVVTADSLELAVAGLSSAEQPAIVIPCAPIVDRLSDAALSPGLAQGQIPLPFAPQAVGGKRR